MSDIIEHLNVIDALHEQIESLLDLMQCANADTDMQSVNVAAEMCQTMLDEMMIEINKIGEEYKRKEDDLK